MIQKVKWLRTGEIKITGEPNAKVEAGQEWEVDSRDLLRLIEGKHYETVGGPVEALEAPEPIEPVVEAPKAESDEVDRAVEKATAKASKPPKKKGRRKIGKE